MNIKDMVGKKVTCEILDVEIDDATIQHEDGIYYICQNKQDGHAPYDKLGYKYGWKISRPTQVKGICDFYGTTNLRLAEEEWKPKRGDRVLVNDHKDSLWRERIFVCEVEGEILPYLCVSEGHETSFSKGVPFRTYPWEYMKPLKGFDVETKKKWARAAYILDDGSYMYEAGLFQSKEEILDINLPGVVKVIYPARFDDDGYLIEEEKDDEEKIRNKNR